MTPGHALDARLFLTNWLQSLAADVMFNAVWKAVFAGRSIGAGTDGRVPGRLGEERLKAQVEGHPDAAMPPIENAVGRFRGADSYLTAARWSQQCTLDVFTGPAVTYVVTEDMAQLVVYAAEQLDEAPTLQPWELPSGDGIMFMEVPLYDVDGSEYRSFAFAWSDRWPIGAPSSAPDEPASPGIMLTCFIDAESFGFPRERFGSRWLPMDITGWQFGKDAVATGLRDQLMERGQTAYDHVVRTRKLLYAVWHLANERITREDGDRQARRRFERQARRPAPKVSVVDIRRRSNPHPKGTQEHVEWTRRWIVSGHWRRQWYATSQEHRPIWIEPYVKGPDDLPLGEPRPKVKVVKP